MHDMFCFLLTEEGHCLQWCMIIPLSKSNLNDIKQDTSMYQCYKAFSLTWPASTLIYWNRTKHLHEKRVQLPEDFLGTPTWPPFHCFGTGRNKLGR